MPDQERRIIGNVSRRQFLKGAAGGLAASLAGVEASASTPSGVKRASRRTLIRSADVLTMDGALSELFSMDVLIEEDKIVQIGKHLQASDAHVIDAAGMILMPGLVDGHRHVWTCIDAGRVVKTDPRQYSAYQDWKMRVMVCLTPEDHYLAAYVGGLQAIDSGVTSVLDYANGQQDQERAIASVRGLKDSGVAGWFAYQVSHTPTYHPGQRFPLKEAIAQRAAVSSDSHFRTLQALQRDHLGSSHAPLQLGMALSVGCFGKPVHVVAQEFQRARDMGIRMIVNHCSRPPKPFPVGSYGARGSGIADLHEAGLLGPELHLTHGFDLTTDELILLRDSGGMFCATPMNDYPSLRPGRASRPSAHGRARALGVATGIGIDVALCLTQDFLEHVRATLWSLSYEPESFAIASQYRAADILNFATRSGAAAIRLDGVTGSIEVGKRADLLLVNTDRVDFLATGGLADRVVGFARQSDIDSVWIAGRLRKHQGRMLDVDWKALKTRVEATQNRISREAASIEFT